LRKDMPTLLGPEAWVRGKMSATLASPEPIVSLLAVCGTLFSCGPGATAPSGWPRLNMPVTELQAASKRHSPAAVTRRGAWPGGFGRARGSVTKPIISRGLPVMQMVFQIPDPHRGALGLGACGRADGRLRRHCAYFQSYFKAGGKDDACEKSGIVL